MNDLDLNAIEALNDSDWEAGSRLDEAPATIRLLIAALREAQAEIAMSDTLIAERNQVLDALPCPTHGQCVPYVLSWITERKATQP